MIVPLRHRGEFQRLRAEGRRYRSDLTWCVHRADAATETSRVAFAIGRNVGTAVVRNRLRRRLRAIVREIPLAPGDYLFGVQPAARGLRYEHLRAMIIALVSQVARP